MQTFAEVKYGLAAAQYKERNCTIRNYHAQFFEDPLLRTSGYKFMYQQSVLLTKQFKEMVNKSWKSMEKKPDIN